MKSFFLSFLYLSFSLSSFAAVKSKTPSVKALKENLTKQTNEIYKMGSEIRTLEEELGQKNNLYLEKIKQISQLEIKVDFLREELKKSEKEQNLERENIEKIYKRFLLERVEETDDVSLLRQKIFLQALNKKKKEVDLNLIEINTLKNNLKLYSKALEENKMSQETIGQLIVDLEKNKKNLASTYLNKVNQKNTTENKLKEVVSKQRAMKAQKKETTVLVDAVFDTLILPIKNQIGYSKTKKGINFQYKNIEPLYSSEAGKIVFAGNLESYGNVIIIDHGNDIRSVLLGDINIKKQKGDSVKLGDIVAYTKDPRGITKNVYYELRKNNKVQDTYALLTKNKSNNLHL